MVAEGGLGVRTAAMPTDEQTDQAELASFAEQEVSSIARRHSARPSEDPQP